MLRSRHIIMLLIMATANLAVHAQVVQTSGAQVVVPATGTVTVPNDQVRVTFMIEEQDKDRAVAASRVNRKMKQGSDIIKQQDPQALLKTRAYFTWAVYADEAQHVSNPPQPRALVGWRVGQYLEVTTINLAALPRTVAAAQGVMALNGIEFGLTPTTNQQLDATLIDATYKNLHQRIESIARAMARTPADAVIETLDFEGSGNHLVNNFVPKAMMMRAVAPAQETVAEPNFEAGETTVSMHLVGRIRFQ